MKMTFLILAAALFMVGCGNKSSTPATTSAPATNNVTTAAPAPAPAPDGYLGTLVQAQKSSDNKIDTAYLNQAIQQFNIAEGRYPTNLQELTPNYVAKIPTSPLGYKLNYDPASGTVTVVKQ
ncbi:MAG TPA: hypothetical protein VGI03_07225 [Verrucomicrobiae bacterium]|jgi:hypothetical protein